MNCTESIRSERGSISIFAAVVVSGIIILNAVLYDYALLKSQLGRNEAELKLACNSVLASYDALLAKRYGLYGYYTGSGGSVSDEFERYYSGNALEASLSGAFTEADVLKDQIRGIMKIKTPLNLAETLLKIFDVISDGTENSGDFSVCAEASEMLYELQNTQKKLKDKVEGYFTNDTACVNGYSHAESITIAEALLKGGEDINPLKNNLMLLTEQYLKYNSEAAVLCKDLVAKRNDIIDYISNVPDGSMAYTEVQNIRSQAMRAGSEYAENKIAENVNVFTKRLEFLQNAGEDFLSDVETFKNLFIDMKINTDIKINTVNAVYSESEGDERDFIQENLEKLSESLTQEDSYVIPADEYASMPSVRSGISGSGGTFSFTGVSLESFDDFAELFEASEEMSLGAALEDIGENILIDDYIMTYMTDRLYGSSADKINNEIEYILSGNASSAENNQSVENRIILIRFVINFIDISSDSERSAIAEAMASAIAAAVSSGSGTTLFKYIIIAGWALIDSYMDLHTLLSGGNVPIISFGDTADGKLDKLQDYSFYLRILLMFMPRQTKLMRICDMIEVNMKEITGMSYRLSGVYNSLDVKTSAKVEFVFIPGIYSKEFYIEDESKVSY